MSLVPGAAFVSKPAPWAGSGQRVDERGRSAPAALCYSILWREPLSQQADIA